MTPQPIVHNIHRYKVYGCRCDVCRAAMSAYKKARYVPVVQAPIVAQTQSWWLTAKPDGFTATVEREHYARMRASRFGSGLGKSITTDEVSR